MMFLTGVFSGITQSRNPIGEDYLLDKISDAPILAVSLRLLRASYSGFCLQVQRADNNALVNIGFVDGYIDVAALQGLLAQTNLYLNKWYGQDEAETNLTAQNYSYKPKVTVSGGKAKIDFGWNAAEIAANSFGGVMRTAQTITATAPKSFFVCNPYQVSGNNYLQDFGANQWNAQFYSNNFSAYNGAAVTAAVSTGLAQYGVLYGADNYVSLRRSGAQLTSGNPSTGASDDYFSLGNYANGIHGYGFRGEIFEYIAFEKNVSEVSTIENDQIDYFEIN